MRIAATWTIALTLTLCACGGGNEPSAPGSNGAPAGPAVSGPTKADQVADSTDKLTCTVVQVSDEKLLENVGAIYMMDNDGNLLSDFDTTGAEISFSALSLQLGYFSFSKTDGDDVRLSEELAEQDAPAYRAMEVETAEQMLQVRVFDKSKVGAVFQKASPDAKWEQVATLDCQGEMRPNYVREEVEASCAAARLEAGACRADGRDADKRCCESVCTVVEVIDTMLEESLGSIYELDADGRLQCDADSTDVSFQMADGADVWIGNNLFETESGDRITVSSGGQYDETAYQKVAVASADAGYFEIRVFDAHRLGVVMHADSESEALSQLAVIDCRGVPKPAFE